MITIEVDDKLIIATLTGIEGKLENPGGLMAQIAELLLDSTVERFQTGTAPDGTPWAPKSSTTIAAYEARKEPVSLKPLIGPTKSLSNISNFATAFGDDWARISSRAIQSAVMQFGAPQGAFGAFIGIDKRGAAAFPFDPLGRHPGPAVPRDFVRRRGESDGGGQGVDFSKLKNNRRLETRFDKTADSLLGFVDVACIRL